MIIVMKPGAPEEEIEAIRARIRALGLEDLHMPGSERVVLGALGDERVLETLNLRANPFVEDVKPILAPYKSVSREFKVYDTVVRVGAAEIGGDAFVVAAGPPAIESAEQIRAVAEAAKAAGASVLRGGVYLSPLSRFDPEGRGPEALEELLRAGAETGLPVAAEALARAQMEELGGRVQAIVIGEQNMRNFVLLDAAANAQKESGAAILLQRGAAATVEEFLLAAEHVLDAGAPDVALVERGVRGFGAAGQHLDLGAVPFIKQRSHLPVLVDPSAGAGRADFVAPMALAACACGADGVLLDVHPAPKTALAGGERALDVAGFNRLMAALAPIAAAVGRSL